MEIWTLFVIRDATSCTKAFVVFLSRWPMTKDGTNLLSASIAQNVQTLPT